MDIFYKEFFPKNNNRMTTHNRKLIVLGASNSQKEPCFSNKSYSQFSRQLLFPHLETSQLFLYFVCRVVLSLTILDCTVWLAAIKLTCLWENTCVSQIFFWSSILNKVLKMMPRSIDLDLMHVMFLQTFTNNYLEVVFQYFLMAKY